MVSIKVICDCGQKYAFDVHPLNGRMPASVQCPVCGRDGTAAANEILARTPGAQPSTLTLQRRPALDPPAATPPARQPPVADDKQGGGKWWRRLLAGLPGSQSPATSGGGPPVSDDVWRQRALEAEWRAEQALAAARADLAPHLAQALKEALVQELANQRKELLQAQQIAMAEMAQLTRHLDELKAPIQERLRSYETRIQELERELSARTEENRELLKLKIEMMRQQMEVERTRSRVEFN